MDVDKKEINELKTRVALLEKMVLNIIGANEHKDSSTKPRINKNTTNMINRVRRIV